MTLVCGAEPHLAPPLATGLTPSRKIKCSHYNNIGQHLSHLTIYKSCRLTTQVLHISIHCIAKYLCKLTRWTGLWNFILLSFLIWDHSFYYKALSFWEVCLFSQVYKRTYRRIEFIFYRVQNRTYCKSNSLLIKIIKRKKKTQISKLYWTVWDREGGKK